MADNKEKLVPEIRFKGFTSAWEQRTLDTIFGRIRNAFGGTATPYYVEDGYFYLESNNIKDGQINRDKEVFINEEFYFRQKELWLKTGDIVMVQSGHVGHTAVIPSELDNSAAHALIMFSDYLEPTAPHFLNYQFQADKAVTKLALITTGNTIKHILASEMKKFEIDIPLLPEQTAIGNFFRTLDDTITLCKRKLDGLKKLKSGYLQQMFPQAGECVPRIRFAGFSEPWEKKKLGEVLKINSGRDYKHLNDGDIPVYGTGGYMLSVDESLSEIDAIGIGRKGTIDKPRLLTAPFWTVDTLFFMTPFHDNYLSFLYALSQNIEWAKMDESTGVPLLSKVNIESVDVYIPKVAEQTFIGNFFRNLDEQIAAQQTKLDKLKQLKSAYLQKMFI